MKECKHRNEDCEVEKLGCEGCYYNERKEVKEMKNKYYIVRGDRSGVFAGNIEKREGQEVTMTNVRRLWYWDGACSISELALRGTQKPDKCKFTVTIEEITVIDAIEVIPTTDIAENSIKSVKDWEF